MTDDTAKAAEQSIVFHGNAAAPFIYFDAAPTFGIMQGAIQVELLARTLIADGQSTKPEFVVTGHLRCSPTAARDLRDAIDKALLLLVPVENPEGPKN